MSVSSNRETEIKLHAPSPMAAAELLTTRGFRVVKPRVHERNLLFDLPSGEIRSSGCLLRVRASGESGKLTFKGVASPGRHKSREEIEVEVSDPQALEQILGKLGYTRTFIYEKFRTEFEEEEERPRGTVTLDETPIGTFLELEGDGKWIDESAERLGFSPDDYLTASYGRLYLDWCAEHNRRPENMVWTENESVI